MSVIESGHHEMAVHINDLGLRPLQFENVALLADLLNAVAANGHGVGPLGLVKRRCHRDPGINVAVQDDDVRPRRRWLLLRWLILPWLILG